MNNLNFDGLTGTKVKIDQVTVTIEEKIADGKLSVVYKCSDDRGKQYALKVFGADDVDVFQAIIDKAAIHRSIAQHPNVVSIFGLLVNPQAKTAFELMELCQNNLSGIMKASTAKFDIPKIIDIFQSVCTAVHGMHTSRPMIVHQNIKSKNVLLSRGIWKICDFQMSMQPSYLYTHEQIQAHKMIEKYSKKRVLAPESFHALDDENEISLNQSKSLASSQLSNHASSTKNIPAQTDLVFPLTLKKVKPESNCVHPSIDIWALGCLLFRLCTFKPPFHHNDRKRIESVQYKWPKNQEIDQRFKSIVALCLQQDPLKRPTITELLGELYTSFPDIVDQRWKPSKQSPQKPTHAFVLMQSTDNNTYSHMNSPVRENDVSAEPRALGLNRKVSSNDLNRSRQHFAGMYENISLKDGNNADGNETPTSPLSLPPTNSPTPLSPTRRHRAKLNNSTYNLSSNNHMNCTNLPASNSASPSPAPFSHPQHNSNHRLPLPGQHKKISKENHELIHRMKNDETNLAVELLALEKDEFKMKLIIMRSLVPQVLSHFAFRLLHCSKTRLSYVLGEIDELSDPLANAVWESRMNIYTKYSMIEGNFSIDTLKANHGNKPLVIGDPPVCIETAVLLQEHLQLVLNLLNNDVQKEYSDEMLFTYQLLTYIINKLINCDNNTEKLKNEVIPKLNNEQFPSIVKYVRTNNFPSEPYRFEKGQLKSIRSPSCFKTPSK